MRWRCSARAHPDDVVEALPPAGVICRSLRRAAADGHERPVRAWLSRASGVPLLRQPEPGSLRRGDSTWCRASPTSRCWRSERQLFGAELAEASRHKSEFLANMSHERRAVLGYAELIQDGIYGEVPAKRGARARPAERPPPARLINDALQDRGRPDGPNTQCASWCWRQRDRGARGREEARSRSTRRLPRGRGDERRLTQVLLNLVSNAIKFTEAAHPGEGRGRQLPGRPCDTGVGIAEADRERIFGEFQQVDSSTRKKGGTGSGDREAHRRAARRPIWVESTPGPGLDLRVHEQSRHAELGKMIGTSRAAHGPEHSDAVLREEALRPAGSIIIPRSRRRSRSQWKHFVPATTNGSTALRREDIGSDLEDGTRIR